MNRERVFFYNTFLFHYTLNLFILWVSASALPETIVRYQRDYDFEYLRQASLAFVCLLNSGYSLIKAK